MVVYLALLFAFISGFLIGGTVVCNWMVTRYRDETLISWIKKRIDS